MTVGSGAQCSMWLSESGPLGACSKILLESLHWASSGEYCYVWERLDTRFDCSSFRLTQLEPSTDGSECLLLGTVMTSEGGPNAHTVSVKTTLDRISLWQTPVAGDAIDREKGLVNSRGEPKLSAQVKLWRTPDANCHRGADDGERRLEAGHALTLNDQVKTPKLWPTPDAGNFNSGENPQSYLARRQKLVDKGTCHGMGMNLAVAAKLWPTPTDKGNYNKAGLSEKSGDGLATAAAQTGQGSLNPAFVEWLMGFPPGFTELKCPLPSPHKRSPPEQPG